MMVDRTPNPPGAGVELAAAAVTPPGEVGATIFISHENADHGLAIEIRRHLEDSGLTCWMAPDDVSGSTPWPEQIAQAIDDCDVMLVVVSAHANGSPHVSREVDLAIENGKALLPVRVEDIAPAGALNYLLRLAQWIDVFPGSIAEHAASLQAMVGSMLQERGLQAPQPAVGPDVPSARRLPTEAIIAIAAAALLLIVVIVAIIAVGGDGDVDTIADDVQTAESVDPVDPVGTTGEDGGVGQDASDAGQGEPVDGGDDVDPPVGEPATDPGTDPGADLPILQDKGDMVRVSVASDGSEADGDSFNPVISADGRFVAFGSVASNLVDGDTGAHSDVFVHDRTTGETTRISELPDGEEGNGDSHTPRISDDGRFVVYVSQATNLDPGDANEVSDIFLHDRETGATNLVSVASDGSQHRLHSIEPSMSDDGTLIGYATWKDAEIPYFGPPVSGLFTGWVFDATTFETFRLADFSFAGFGPCTASGPRVSGDGTIALFECSGLVAPLIFARATGMTTPLPLSGDLRGDFLTPSPTGERIYLGTSPEDIHPVLDRNIAVFDRSSGEVSLLAELNKTWTLSIWSISSDGRFLAAEGSDEGGPYSDVYIVGTDDGQVISLAQEFGIVLTGRWQDVKVDLSGDGGQATFSSELGDLVAADSNQRRDVFVIQLQDTAGS